MKNYCENPEHKNDPDWHYIKNKCPYCRIAELEQQREGYKEHANYAWERVKELEQQLEEAHTELAISIKERIILGGQNAKMVEVLEKLSKLGNGDKVGNSVGNQISAAALKEMEVKGE